MTALLRFARLVASSPSPAKVSGLASTPRLLSSLSHQPSAELLDQEPLGAWRHHAWTQVQDFGAVGAYKILQKRLEELGPQRQLQLVAMLNKINTAEEANLGLHAIAIMRRFRAHHQQHTPFNKDVIWKFLEACVRAKAYDTMVEAMQRHHELGLGDLSLRLYSCCLVELLKADRLDQAVRVFETMPRNGVQPSRKIGLLLIRACQRQGNAELAEAFQQEFETNGVQLS